MTNSVLSPTNSEPLAYTINDAVRVSAIGRTKLYQLLANGTIQSRRIGKRRLVVASSLRALIEGEGA